MGKREQTMTSELTDTARRGATPSASSSAPSGRSAREVRPLGDGDRTRFTFELEFDGHALGRLLVPLFVRRQAARELSESHSILKRQLESRA